MDVLGKDSLKEQCCSGMFLQHNFDIMVIYIHIYIYVEFLEATFPTDP